MSETITGAQTPNHGKNHGKNGGAEREELLVALKQEIASLTDPHTFDLVAIDLNLMDLMALQDIISLYKRTKKAKKEEYSRLDFFSDEELKHIKELSQWVLKIKERKLKDENANMFGSFLANKMGAIELASKYAAYAKARRTIG